MAMSKEDIAGDIFHGEGRTWQGVGQVEGKVCQD